MNSKDIDLLCRRDRIINPYFRGVFALNILLEDIYKYIDFKSVNIFIFNSQPSYSSKGGHWLLLVVDVDPLNNGIASIQYFDSFAKSPRTYDEKLASLLFNLSTYLTDGGFQSAPFRVQSADSRLCGLYCIFVAHCLMIKKFFGRLPTLIREKFSPISLLNNDHYLLNWFRRTIAPDPLMLQKCFSVNNEGECVLSYSELFEKVHSLSAVTGYNY